MENPIKIHDLGVPLFSETSNSYFQKRSYNLGNHVKTMRKLFVYGWDKPFSKALPRDQIWRDFTGVITWDPFLGGIKVDTNLWSF